MARGGARTKQTARKPPEGESFKIATRASAFQARNPKSDNSEQPNEAPPPEPVRPTKTSHKVWDAMSTANKIKEHAKTEKMKKPKTSKMSAHVWAAKTKSQKIALKKQMSNVKARQLYNCFKK